MATHAHLPDQLAVINLGTMALEGGVRSVNWAKVEKCALSPSFCYNTGMYRVVNGARFWP